jgi:hypothetical protein
MLERVMRMREDGRMVCEEMGGQKATQQKRRGGEK